MKAEYNFSQAIQNPYIKPELTNEHIAEEGKTELHRLLNEGLRSADTNNGRPTEEVFADIERRFGFNKE